MSEEKLIKDVLKFKIHAIKIIVTCKNIINSDEKLKLISKELNCIYDLGVKEGKLFELENKEFNSLKDVDDELDVILSKLEMLKQERIYFQSKNK